MFNLRSNNHLPLLEMFEDRYIPEPNSGCWLWLGAPDPFGYGFFEVDGVKLRAHRFSWTLHNGDIPDGLLVSHRCDVTACVNPNHLFLGTYFDNNRDAVKKGRWKSHNGKLQPNDVYAIRNDCRTTHVVSSEYGVSKTTICDIRAGRTWKHLK